MKKVIFVLLTVLIAMLQTTVCADYIVKTKYDIEASDCAETDLTPLIPKLGLYTVDDISGIDPDKFEFIENDRPVDLFDTYDFNYAENQSAHSLTKMRRMWDLGVYGSGVRVGVIDSGCSPVEALKTNLREGKDFSGGDGSTTDNIGHGTSVCGMIAAEYGFDVLGTAHKSEIIPLKFIDQDKNGSVVGGTTSRLVEAIISAVDDYNCGVINMSCGTLDSKTLELAIDYAESKGVVMVAAVGNSGNEKKNYPASYENVLGVGSVGRNKEHSSFSNTNDSVFVSAPGESVEIIYNTGQYGSGTGTSYSAPYVSGIVADMLEMDPKLSPEEIMSIISETAEDLGTEGYDDLFGYGLIRADRIVDRMLSEKEFYTSGIDLCPEDDSYEVRFWVGKNYELPSCVLCGYDSEELKQISTDKYVLADNIYIFRLKRAPFRKYKFFIWNNFENMLPLTYPLLAEEA